MLNERKELAELKKYIPGKSIQSVKKELGLKKIIKLASNENPFGSPLTAPEITSEIQNLHQYPDSASADLTEKIAKTINTSKETIILGNGSDDILQMISLAFIEKGDEVIIGEHTFSMYEQVSKVMGATIIKTNMKNLTYNLSEIQNCVTKKTKCIFIANPNNPTGTKLNIEEIETLCQNNLQTLIVLDEAYVEFTTGSFQFETPKLLKKFQNLILTRTFSKCYGLAGLRIGYGVTNTTIIESLKKVRMPFTVNQLALIAASKSLDKKEFIEKTLKNNQEQKEFLYKELNKLNITYLNTEANFICLLLSKEAKTIYEYALKKGLIIRPLNSFDMPNAIRVTIGLKEENELLINILKQAKEEGVL